MVVQNGGAHEHVARAIDARHGVCEVFCSSVGGDRQPRRTFVLRTLVRVTEDLGARSLKHAHPSSGAFEKSPGCLEQPDRTDAEHVSRFCREVPGAGYRSVAGEIEDVTGFDEVDERTD
jgi:hypothetical protein